MNASYVQRPELGTRDPQDEQDVVSALKLFPQSGGRSLMHGYNSRFNVISITQEKKQTTWKHKQDQEKLHWSEWACLKGPLEYWLAGMRAKYPPSKGSSTAKSSGRGSTSIHTFFSYSLHITDIYWAPTTSQALYILGTCKQSSSSKQGLGSEDYMMVIVVKKKGAGVTDITEMPPPPQKKPILWLI